MELDHFRELRDEITKGVKQDNKRNRVTPKALAEVELQAQLHCQANSILVVLHYISVHPLSLQKICNAKINLIQRSAQLATTSY